MDISRIGPYGRQEFKIMDSDSKQMLLPYIAQTADAFVLLLQNAKESAIFSTNENQQVGRSKETSECLL